MMVPQRSRVLIVEDDTNRVFTLTVEGKGPQTVTQADANGYSSLSKAISVADQRMQGDPAIREIGIYEGTQRVARYTRKADVPIEK